jgi:hypothetical protein
MNQNNLLATLQENRLMHTEEQVTNFENALAEIAENPDENNLSAYHLILDDQCQQPEVMFSLIHFLESFDMEKQITRTIKFSEKKITMKPIEGFEGPTEIWTTQESLIMAGVKQFILHNSVVYYLSQVITK